MKLNPIGKNKTEIQMGDRTVFYSYSTPVAVFVGGGKSRGAVVTEKKFSATTSRHIGQILRVWGCSSVEVSQREIERLAGGGELVCERCADGVPLANGEGICGKCAGTAEGGAL